MYRDNTSREIGVNKQTDNGRLVCQTDHLRTSCLCRGFFDDGCMKVQMYIVLVIRIMKCHFPA